MILYIKNMVCNRCVMAVENVFNKLHISGEVSMGQALTRDELSPELLNKLSEKLESLGFEILQDRERQTIEEIKVIIREKISRLELGEMKSNWSDYISDKIKSDYKSTSRLFAAQEGFTIEHYIITQRIEKAKELIIYHQHSFSEIAQMLGYSSTAHLSGQFKKHTGMTPVSFRKDGLHHRKPLDKA